MQNLLYITALFFSLFSILVHLTNTLRFVTWQMTSDYWRTVHDSVQDHPVRVSHAYNYPLVLPLGAACLIFYLIIAMILHQNLNSSLQTSSILHKSLFDKITLHLSITSILVHLTDTLNLFTYKTRHIVCSTRVRGNNVVHDLELYAPSDYPLIPPL